MIDHLYQYEVKKKASVGRPSRRLKGALERSKNHKQRTKEMVK